MPTLGTIGAFWSGTTHTCSESLTVVPSFTTGGVRGGAGACAAAGATTASCRAQQDAIRNARALISISPFPERKT
jgi:hypothetical protein